MNKTVAIIGGSSGIGLQLAKKLVTEQYDVIIAARNIDNLQAIQKELNNKISIYQLDACNETEVMAFAEKLNHIDHLIVTLRGPGVSNSFSDSNTEEVKKAFDGKFWAQYYVIRHCLKKVKLTGSVILTSGIASQRSYPNSYWQASANGAIEALAKSLSVEIAPIRINVISPGFIERKPNDNERLEMVKKIEPKLPACRLATHNEIVEGYIFLMNSTYSTGTVLVIDGGVLCA
jgi:NAD(P)-dependent dehydrogenase (short-subunit alcohol dehydrogenase family)